MVESLVDGAIRDTVIPKIGSILYCDMAWGNAEHSGVYIGNDRIVHLNGDGKIEIVTPQGFLNDKWAVHIYVSCDGEYPVGSREVAARAERKVGGRRSYNLVLDNCHQFSSGCLTGNFENADNFLWMLRMRAKDVLKANTWRVWEREYDS
ncbi:MAG: hypothetical protein EOM12_14835 [Verrucomicrobiae bacterium]|nr:hypothetical protein [Verrucomicrobiae bacterium]